MLWHTWGVGAILDGYLYFNLVTFFFFLSTSLLYEVFEPKLHITFYEV